MSTVEEAKTLWYTGGIIARKFQTHSKIIFFLLAMAGGLIILWPFCDYQPLLAQGDHGRDLYCFKKTLDGGVPYRDYWWVYGPLMPYYYSAFYWLLGVSVKSVLIGKMFLHLAAGAFFYLAVSTVTAPFWACLAALWFFAFNPDFFFTYNHVGGTALSLAVVYFLVLYGARPLRRFVFGGLACIFLLGFVKINIGASMLVGFLLSLALTDLLNREFSFEKKKIYALALVIIPAVWLAIYWLLAKDLPLYYLRQCFPYLRVDHLYYSPWQDSLGFFGRYLLARITQTQTTLALAALIIFSAAAAMVNLRKRSVDENLKRNMLVFVAGPAIFFVLNFHEYIDSGIFYRTFWCAPFQYLLMFILMAIGMGRLPRVVRILLVGALLLIVVVETAPPLAGLTNRRSLNNISIGNSSSWVNTVNQTTQHLTATLKKDETFFAFPYEPLYYFLTQKDSPTHHLLFFTISPPAEEKEIIASLEARKVNYIVMSNRINSVEVDFAGFGKTYGRILAKYIQDNFEETARFGEWEKPAGWAWNHATKIFKRVSPL